MRGVIAAPPHGWARISPAAQGRGRPALFLDRDGVVVDDVGYLDAPSAVNLMPGAAQTIARFRAAGLAVILVTNQSGVGRGYYDWAAFEAVQAEIAARLAAEAQGAAFDAELACGADPTTAAGALHPWRKPASGMLSAAISALDLDAARSRIVGDRSADLVAGRAAGLAGGLLVDPGRSDPRERTEALALRAPGFEVMLGADLTAACAWIEDMAGARARC